MNNRDVISVISESMNFSLINYSNSHAVKVYAPLLGGPKEEPQPEPVIPMKKIQNLLKPSGTSKEPKFGLKKQGTNSNIMI